MSFFQLGDYITLPVETHLTPHFRNICNKEKFFPYDVLVQGTRVTRTSRSRPLPPWVKDDTPLMSSDRKCSHEVWHPTKRTQRTFFRTHTQSWATLKHNLNNGNCQLTDSSNRKWCPHTHKLMMWSLFRWTRVKCKGRGLRKMGCCLLTPLRWCWEKHSCWSAIPENREFKKWKFIFFHQRHALSTSFDIFVVKTRGHAIIFYQKTEFPFLVFPYFPVMPCWSPVMSLGGGGCQCTAVLSDPPPPHPRNSGIESGQVKVESTKWTG